MAHSMVHPRTNAGLIAAAGGIELLEQFVQAGAVRAGDHELAGALEYRGMASWVLAKVRAASEGVAYPVHRPVE